MFLTNGIPYLKIIKALEDLNLHLFIFLTINLKFYLEPRNKSKKL
jgi:hypothetical protein